MNNLSFDLLQTTQHGKARLQALTVAEQIAYMPTTLVEFNSAGRLLIVGTAAQTLPIAQRLSTSLSCLVLITSGEIVIPDTHAFIVLAGKIQSCTGFLGQFELSVKQANTLFNPATYYKQPAQYIDLILDFSENSLFSREIPPLGYFAPKNDSEALEKAILDLQEAVGTFDKPKFFNYLQNICAHGNSGKVGCTNCINACPTEAIISIGDKIAVNPNLCQGAGSCATVCPTGAIHYLYPKPSDTLTKLRKLLKTYHEAGGTHACILFYDEILQARLDELLLQLPESVLPFSVEEVGSVGIEIWLACFAYGADKIVLFTKSTTAPMVKTAVETQLSYAIALITALGYADDALLFTADEAYLLEKNAQISKFSPQAFKFASFAGLDEKRTTLKLAIEHLYQHAPQQPELIALPEGAPFGEIHVNSEACTLCMSCVVVCPSNALSDGQNLPQLHFNESLCVQCHLCERTCPESAIQLQARYLFQQREQTRLLYEEPPFCCISCGKPFATQSVIRRIIDKLKGHKMFQDEVALKRLEMCEDCRVRDLFTVERSK
ncbi:hypothetical protein BegalDRAFT_3547 [Beggiatoa alba B18LD]|uniref:4Fe-4S ferredoxin-type domain-containing protein n=1 Tax=Beggiatoa alba B18LD TaxID=395493 RepID=I3CL62_9GAMM|nr:4Fe-4S binding protein [Beggiatoa alba]EIJ44355.1 hypothetical protein BegalDRAFT_3547 [Beggiatoa alba B18LD]